MKNTNEDQDQMSTSSTLTGSSGRSVSVGDVHVKISELSNVANATGSNERVTDQVSSTPGDGVAPHNTNVIDDINCEVDTEVRQQRSQVNGNQPPVRHKRQSSTNEDLSLKQAEDVKELPNATELNVGVSRNLGDVVAPCTSSVIVDINCEEGSQDKGNQPPGTPTSKCRQPEHNDDLSMTWKNDSQQTSQGHSKNSDVGKDGGADIPKKNENRHHQFEKLFINKIRTFPYFSIVKVLLQMVLIVLGILMCQKWKLYDGEGIDYVLSSILLLLGIFINGNYQRCEKAHGYLTQFRKALSQSSSCLQDCNPSSGLAGEFLKTTDNKSKELKSKVEELQGSKEFSELRKIKEFQQPQTILFYSEILTFFVPIMLCPHFAHIGIKWDNIWSPYYKAVKIVILSEMFQICQNYLINPFANASDILHFDSDASALNHSDCGLSAEIKSERSQADRDQPPDDTVNGNVKDLERYLAKFGLEIENIPKDGDCLFRSILRQLRKMDFDKTEELKDHLRSLNLMTESEDDDISTLRLLFVQECKKRTDDYINFFAGSKIKFIKRAVEFETKGVFDNAVGDLVPRVCCDLLRVPITIFTSIHPQDETEFVPDRPLSNSPIFIVRHHYGAGHYDATNFISTSEKTITRTFVCLAGRDQLTVPTNREKLLLKENGLGEKKLQIPTNASKEQVKEVLYKAFRPLQSCGGFEMLLCADNSRTRLQVVKYGSCNTDELRCLGMGRVYIRPIQVDITLGDIEDDDEHAEECLLCRESIPLRGMRAHMETCRGETRPTETSDDDLPPAFGERGEEERVNPAELPNQLPSGTEQNSLELPEQPPRGTDQASISHDEAAANEEEPVPYEEHMRNALEETLKAMATCDEPVTVLGEFRRRLQRGRMLDLQNDSELCEGKTTEIFVSRYRLFDDAMEEILRDDPPAIDFSLPLEVIFTGEGAQDYGGPRREFLGMVMRDIRDKLFKEEGGGYVIFEKKEALDRKHYYGAGLFFGFSLLQGGPLPTFLAEDQLQRIFKKDDLTNLGEAETQFRVGLERFGLVELLHGKPSLSFLFRKTAVLPMTYPKLVKLLDPIFSDEASNRRQREERTYRLFLNYLKEVSAGRRVDGNISLHSILKFVTGCENEPVLGFQMKPSICFDTNMPSCLPIGNTCISRLTLPIGENVSMTKEEVFSFFDYAFANDYFGRL